MRVNCSKLVSASESLTAICWRLRIALLWLQSAALLVGACVVDSGYDGEIFVNLHNVGTKEQIITKHDKIAQAVMVPVVHFRALETGSGDLYGWHPIAISSRGAGSLGSTDES